MATLGDSGISSAHQMAVIRNSDESLFSCCVRRFDLSSPCGYAIAQQTGMSMTATRDPQFQQLSWVFALVDIQSALYLEVQVASNIANWHERGTSITNNYYKISAGKCNHGVG